MTIATSPRNYVIICASVVNNVVSSIYREKKHLPLRRHLKSYVKRKNIKCAVDTTITTHASPNQIFVRWVRNNMNFPHGKSRPRVGCSRWTPEFLFLSPHFFSLFPRVLFIKKEFLSDTKKASIRRLTAHLRG